MDIPDTATDTTVIEIHTPTETPDNKKRSRGNDVPASFFVLHILAINSLNRVPRLCEPCELLIEVPQRGIAATKE